MILEQSSALKILRMHMPDREEISNHEIDSSERHDRILELDATLLTLHGRLEQESHDA
jgi:hypothetical protein